MPRIPIFRLGGALEKAALPNLAASTPSVVLEGLSVGVDNLRHDVVLSPRFVELGRAQIARLIARHGELNAVLSAEPLRSAQGPTTGGATTGRTRAPAGRGNRRAARGDRLVVAYRRVAAGESGSGARLICGVSPPGDRPFIARDSRLCLAHARSFLGWHALHFAGSDPLDHPNRQPVPSVNARRLGLRLSGASLRGSHLLVGSR